MTLKEYIRRFKAVRRELAATKTLRAKGVSLDVLAQTKVRVQQTGRNYRGNTFAPYTRLYAQRREADGYQTQYVDFTRRGRLWNSIHPVIRQETPDKTMIDLRPRDSENQDKLDGQFAKRGNILRPSEDELRFARQVWRRRVLKELRPIQ